MVSIFTLMILAVQRCMAVTLSGTPMAKLSSDNSVIKLEILFTWFMGLSFALPPLFGWSTYVPESSGLRYKNLIL